MSNNAAGRPPKPIDPEAGPVPAFAHELRQLRDQAGLTLRDLVPKTHYSYSTLQAALAGKSLPTWEVTEAFVRACDGDVESWRRRHQAVKVALQDTPEAVKPAEVATATSIDDPSADGANDAPPADSAHAAATEQDNQPAEPAPTVSTSVSVSTSVAISTNETPTSRLRRRILVLVATGLPVALIAVLVLSRTISLETTAGAASNAPTIPPAGSLSLTSSTSPALSGQASGPSPAEPIRSSGHKPPSSTRPSQSPNPSADPPPPGGSGDPAGEDPGRYQGVQEKRLVELAQDGVRWVDIDWWRRDANKPGDLQVDQQGVYVTLGAQLAVIPDTPLADRSRCAQVTRWRDRIPFSELHVGSQLCATSRAGRYASMQIRVLPNSPSSVGRFIFYGITWN